MVMSGKQRTSVIGLSFFFPLAAGMSPSMNSLRDLSSAARSLSACRAWKLFANLPRAPNNKPDRCNALPL